MTGCEGHLAARSRRVVAFTLMPVSAQVPPLDPLLAIAFILLLIIVVILHSPGRNVSHPNRLSPPFNFRWVVKNKLALSARPYSKRSLRWLKDQGIKSIVSLTVPPLDREEVKALGFEYLHLPMVSGPGPEQIDAFMDFAKRMSRSGKPMLVHCDAGQVRSSTLSGYYLTYGCHTIKATENPIEE